MYHCLCTDIRIHVVMYGRRASFGREKPAYGGDGGKGGDGGEGGDDDDDGGKQ